ncbi:ATP-dependent RNA helicase dbp9 [Capsaspora owczarzaki ATCC 30864]|nr:ATP-dependent RNA helicase dbp9 [Capsaspora owczarzaki ATCC 30864]|eukprot:XP_004349501.2 ATP-dependent RNA helicase dbp9 [Capsaspora owczarzaki ATCC 30864]
MSDVLSFDALRLDPRLQRAIAKLGWSRPTLIQAKAIPLALQGKDILARARTGSGKTAAYAIPVIQRILADTAAAAIAVEQVQDGASAASATSNAARSGSSNKQQGKNAGTGGKKNVSNAASAAVASSSHASPAGASVKAIVLVPTRELSLQAKQNFKDLTQYCSREVTAVELAGDTSATAIEAQRHELLANPDIVIGTPSRIVAHIEAGHLDVRTSLQMIVVDEADLVFGFGYENDIKTLLRHLPRIVQAFLMSATLSPDVDSLKRLMLHSPVILKLQESQLPDADRLMQYVIKCDMNDKFLLVFTFLKLRLLRGKTIIFVNDVDRCYRVKLFLEQFGIRACVLNSELPQNSRYHIVQEFNRGVYDYIIATDEHDSNSQVDDSDSDSDNDEEESNETAETDTVEAVFENDDDAEQATTTATASAEPVATAAASKGKAQQRPKRKAGRKAGADSEYGVARGIDFQNVSNVINFDFPETARSYVHRVGRTARGDKSGQSLSLIAPEDEGRLAIVQRKLSKHNSGHKFQQFQFAMHEIAAFRYRAADALRAVTAASVKEARLKEIKNEIFNSQKLKAYFEDNPKDLEALRHDKPSHPARIQAHLKHIPSYLMPESLMKKKLAPAATSEAAAMAVDGEAAEEAPEAEEDLAASEPKPNTKHRGKQPHRGMKRPAKADPLKSFAANPSKRFAQG